MLNTYEINGSLLGLGTSSDYVFGSGSATFTLNSTVNGHVIMHGAVNQRMALVPSLSGMWFMHGRGAITLALSGTMTYHALHKVYMGAETLFLRLTGAVNYGVQQFSGRVTQSLSLVTTATYKIAKVWHESSLTLLRLNSLGSDGHLAVLAGLTQQPMKMVTSAFGEDFSLTSAPDERTTGILEILPQTTSTLNIGGSA